MYRFLGSSNFLVRFLKIYFVMSFRCHIKKEKFGRHFLLFILKSLTFHIFRLLVDEFAGLQLLNIYFRWQGNV